MADRATFVSDTEPFMASLFSTARRMTGNQADAEDLVQGFLARFVEKRDLGGADPARGRFRAFLLGAFRHHAQNVDRDAKAAKRGGGQAARIREASPDGAGVHVCIDCTGHPAVWRDTMESLRPGGLALLFGGCAPGTACLPATM